jgi:preprotein translocase subunit SecD
MPPALQNPLTLWFLLTAALAGLVYAFMRPELRWKAIGYGAFLLACAVAIWPPYERQGVPGKIRLGLDLRGGIHLVMQVVVEDALTATVDDAVTAMRDQAGRKGIQVATTQRVSPTSYSVEGVEPARVKDMRDLLVDYSRSNWEVREAGEGRFAVQMAEVYQRQLKDQTVRETIRTLERRVNALGVTEPVIAATGSRGDQILVQLPGVTDVEQA